MPEPIGGREFDWRKLRPSCLARDVDSSARILGWILTLVLPLLLGAWLIKLRPLDVLIAAWKDVGFGAKFAASVGVFISWCVGLLFSAAWFATSALCLVFLLRAKNGNQMNTLNGGSNESSLPKAADGGANAAQPESRASSAAQAKPAETSAVKAETVESSSVPTVGESAEKAAAEREFKEKLRQATKDFEAKVVRLKAALPSKHEFNGQMDGLELGRYFTECGLKGEVRSSFLRAYLSLDADSMTLSVNDPSSFCREESCVLKVDVTDPTVSADPLLRDHVPRGDLTITIVAAYPSSLKKFAEWASKAKTLLRLKNVRQGEPMSVPLADELSVSPEWAAITAVQIPAGLAFDPEKAVLSGLPEVGSDMKIHFVVECKGAPRAKQEVTFLLTCNMDPELKWREIQETDSDKAAVIKDDQLVELAKMAEAVRSTASSFDIPKPDDTFSKSHRVSRRVQAGGFDLAYASIRGRSHIRSGSFREDDVDIRFFEEGKAVAIVVSDGAGSAPLSRRGSAIVTKVGVQCLVTLGRKLLDTAGALEARSPVAIEGFASVVRDIRAQIEFEADCIQKQRPDFQAKEMHATFLAALVLPTPAGNVLLTYSAGDGAIGLGLAGEESGLKCDPDHGQSAGQTLFILNKAAEDADKRLKFTRLPASFVLMLMSDGVSDARIAHGEEAASEVWNKFAEELMPLVAKEPVGQAGEVSESYKAKGPLCEWLDSYEKGHHDDRTIAVLHHQIS